jgi:hypothetical protein
MISGPSPLLGARVMEHAIEKYTKDSICSYTVSPTLYTSVCASVYWHGCSLYLLAGRPAGRLRGSKKIRNASSPHNHYLQWRCCRTISPVGSKSRPRKRPDRCVIPWLSIQDCGAVKHAEQQCQPQRVLCCNGIACASNGKNVSF